MSLGPIATFLLIPPVNLLPVALCGVMLARRRPRWGLGIAGAALAMTWVLSTGVVSGLLIQGLETWPVQAPIGSPEAIVILSAEAREGMPGGLVEGVDAGPITLARLRAGARLARRTGLPVLTSGGAFRQDRPSLGAMMADVLLRDFAVGTAWVETKSSDTWENAVESAAILKPAHVRTVYLVTHAWHMRRSMIAFRHAGLEPVAAPERLQPPVDYEFSDFLPTPQSWMKSYLAIHEWIGCAVYAVRARLT